jgi:hypothetical protein
MHSRMVLICMAGLVVLGAGAATAAAPVAGSVAGPVTSVSGPTFELTTSLSPTGNSTVHVGPTTVITEQSDGTRADLKKGVCATAIGPKKGKGVVAASRIMISQPVNGQCGAGFGRGGRPSGSGPRLGGTQPPRPPGGSRGFANFGFATGAITAIDGSTMMLRGRQGTTSFTVSAKAQVTKTVRLTASAIKLKLCAFVRGTSIDRGVTVTAQDVGLSKPGSTGCTPRFRRP